VSRSQIRVRAARSEDRDFIVRLGKRTVMDSAPARRHAEPVDVLESYDRLLEIVESQSHAALVAEDGEAPVGFVLMLDQLDDEVTGQAQGFIAYMAVERAYRNRGVGAALLKAAEDEARRRGLPYMALMVTEENAPARALYERAGYVTERRLLCKTL
jgi:ribosomal protein S18 acetylase RimI-like enzyme